MMGSWKYSAFVLCIIAVAFLFVFKNNRKEATTVSTKSEVAKSEHSMEGSIPPEAFTTWAYIQTHQTAPNGYIGGRVFKNLEKHLPILPPNQHTGYVEWDIYPKVKGENRGPHRLVSYQFKRAWYTPDHYNTFIELKK